VDHTASQDSTPNLTRYAYLAQQAAIRAPLAVAHLSMRPFTKPPERPSRDEIMLLQRRLRELLEKDLQNVEQRLYPKKLLFQMPVRSYLRDVPRLASEFARVMKRAREGKVRDLPPDIQLERYPEYFRRNFHWQTDGYFSDRSAELYDASVEFLFLGTADTMRRQIVPPVTRFLQTGERKKPVRVLDVACGTGSALNQLALAHPDLKYFGLDLSPYYLKQAAKRLAHVRDLSLIADNAEKMPFRDAEFDVVTSVYLFHELPVRARANVFSEMRRVLKPGGLLVVEDAAQLVECSELRVFLDNFGVSMNEPFFHQYIRDDLAARIAEAEFENITVDSCFLSKVVAGTRRA
jgi:ubiquinone/menaquinone biosynthesis C-methylase UbiE